MRLRSLLAGFVLVAGASTGLVATATPAAALPTCQGFSVYSDGFDQFLRLTTVSNSRNINCVLGVGNRGETVIHLQLTLSICYGQRITIDGIYGSQTAGAVRNVQRFHGITVDGTFGPQTNLVMFWRYYHYENRCYPFR